jgi:hypothetical protein
MDEGVFLPLFLTEYFCQQNINIGIAVSIGFITVQWHD